jgi:acetylornithine aminotransferase
MPLVSENFFADPRLAQAKQLLRQALLDHQKSLTAIRPADPARKIQYDNLIARFGDARGGKLYFPYLGSGIGNGPFVELADGSVKFDFISGIGVHHFGHSHLTLIDAGIDAALRDTIMQGNLQQNIESAGVSATLLDRAGGTLQHCFVSTSGAMANENALKLAFHKRPGATRVLAFEHTFSGRTLALSSLTDKAAYRIGLPSALNVDYIPFFDHAHPQESTARAVAVLRNHLDRYPNQHAALWCELVLGEGGFYPGSTEFFTVLMKEAKAKNIAVVADEIQTFGRTSRLFAFQHFKLGELVDIVTTGKMLQLCAMLFTDPFKPAPGIISQTFTASTSAIFAANMILKELLSDKLFGDSGRNMQLHDHFVRGFSAIAGRHPDWIRGPYGIGGMIAFTPLDGSEKTAKSLLTELFNAGVIAFYNGANPTRLRFLPPLPVITEGQIDTVCEILESCLAKIAAAPVPPTVGA